MTVFQKIISVTFSVIVLIVACLFILTLGGILEPTFGSDIMEDIVQGDFWSKVFFAISVILLILSIKEIAFGEKISSEGKEGIILENESGKLIISKESLENLIAGVGNVNVVVNREVVIKEISTELQKKVKAALKQTADLDVKYVNIKIKNISNKKMKKTNDKNEIVVTEEKLPEKENNKNKDVKEG